MFAYFKAYNINIEIFLVFLQDMFGVPSVKSKQKKNAGESKQR